MTVILRADDANPPAGVAAWNFDDFLERAGRHLDEARREAEATVSRARDEAESIRRRAEEEGRQAGLREIERMTAERTAPAVEALQKAAAELLHQKQAWLSQWETAAVRVAIAVAEKVIRRELHIQPDIPLALIREALELAAGSPDVRLRLNPIDHDALSSQVRALIETVSAGGDAEIASDPGISRGGCVVETRFGSIDQRIESQLRRIEEEWIDPPCLNS